MRIKPKMKAIEDGAGPSDIKKKRGKFDKKKALFKKVKIQVMCHTCPKHGAVVIISSHKHEH